MMLPGDATSSVNGSLFPAIPGLALVFPAPDPSIQNGWRDHLIDDDVGGGRQRRTFSASFMAELLASSDVRDVVCVGSGGLYDPREFTSLGINYVGLHRYDSVRRFVCE